MSQSSCFRTRFLTQSVDVSQTLLKSPRQHFYPNFQLIENKLSQKTSLRVRSEILGLFLDTLAADHTYSRHNWAKFQQEIQTILSQKWKTHSGIFIAFFQSTQNFAHLEKKDQFHSLSIREVIDSKKCGYLNA